MSGHIGGEGRLGGESDDCIRVNLSLRIYSAKIDIDHITMMLGIEPTSATRMGNFTHADKFGERQIVRSFNSWVLNSNGHVVGRDIGAHLEWMLNSLSKARTVFQDLRSQHEAKTEVFVIYWSNTMAGSFSIDPRHIEQLGELGIKLYVEFAVYQD